MCCWSCTFEIWYGDNNVLFSVCGLVLQAWRRYEILTSYIVSHKYKCVRSQFVTSWLIPTILLSPCTHVLVYRLYYHSVLYTVTKAYVTVWCCSANIILVIRSRTVGWAGYITRMGGQERCIQGFGVGVKVMLIWLFKKWNWRRGMYWCGSGGNRWRAVVNAVMNLRGP